MSLSTFNFQFYNYKMPQLKTANSFSELEMDIDEEEQQQQQVVRTMPAITSTPLANVKQPARMPTPRYSQPTALHATLEALRPQLHRPQKRWSMELREKVLEMSRRSNGSDGEETPRPGTSLQQHDANATFCGSNEPAAAELKRSVSDKIDFFNKLTNTYESNNGNQNNQNNNNGNNRFISLLRSSRPLGVATTNSSPCASPSPSPSPVPPPKPKRLHNTSINNYNAAVQHQFATPSGRAPGGGHGGAANSAAQRKSSLRRKPSVEKSRASIVRQNSNATLRPQRHAMMEDLSLVVPVRLRIAEYEQRISMSA